MVVCTTIFVRAQQSREVTTTNNETTKKMMLAGEVFNFIGERNRSPRSERQSHPRGPEEREREREEKKKKNEKEFSHA